MSRFVLSSDWHLGQDNIINYRPQFSTPEEHHETIFDNCATYVRPGDTLILTGDIVLSKEWLPRINEIKCVKKILVLGNHCTDHKVHIKDLALVFDDIHSMYSRRNCLFTHAPVHPLALRKKNYNIHGHEHFRTVDDPRYKNICLEQWDYRPITFAELMRGERDS